MREMRALTIQQPWAWAIATQGKDIENRTWKTPYRGLLAIHAGATLDAETAAVAVMPTGPATRALRKICAEVTLAQQLTEACEHLRMRRIVAVAELTRIHRENAGRCSAWAMPGQWHWELRNVRALAEPVPCHPGKLGIWPLPDEVEKAVREQLGRDVTAAPGGECAS